jgi:hypothetical protein
MENRVEEETALKSGQTAELWRHYVGISLSIPKGRKRGIRDDFSAKTGHPLRMGTQLALECPAFSSCPSTPDRKTRGLAVASF